MAQREMYVECRIKVRVLLAYDSDPEKVVEDIASNADYSITYENIELGAVIVDTELIDVSTK